MSIRITRTAAPHTGAGLPPISDDISVVDAAPALVFVRIYRAAYSIAATVAPGSIDAGIYPSPDGAPWSQRGITPGEKCLGAPHVQHHDPVRECVYSQQAWALALPGSRYRMQFETYDAGFIITWTLEHL